MMCRQTPNTKGIPAKSVRSQACCCALGVCSVGALGWPYAPHASTAALPSASCNPFCAGHAQSILAHVHQSRQHAARKPSLATADSHVDVVTGHLLCCLDLLLPPAQKCNPTAPLLLRRKLLLTAAGTAVAALPWWRTWRRACRLPSFASVIILST
jgi:hypothetical protein